MLIDVQIRDVVALEGIPPIALRAYLESRGWELQENWRNRLLIWTKERDGQVHQILMPLHELSGSYATRIYEALSLFAELEDRSQLDVYYDLRGARADVVRIRPLRGVHDQSWSLFRSVELLEVARDLMTAAARAAESPNQPVYRGRASGTVTDYVRGVQALPGYSDSQELTLHSLVPAGYGEQGYLDDKVRPPFAREVTLALNKSLLGARSAADALNGGTDISIVFEQSKSQGISANSCEALASLAKQCAGVEIDQMWAPARPPSVSDGNFAFTESSADALTAGADWLRRHNPFVDAHIKGEVVLLSRDYSESFDGECVIAHEIDGRPVSLRVKLASEDHPEAIHAFEENLPISIYGDIYRSGNKYTLENPRGFSVTP